MKIKTLVVALVAIVLAGFCAVSCKKAASKITTLILEDTTWKYVSDNNCEYTLEFTSSKNCKITLVFAEHPENPISVEGSYKVDGVSVHIDWNDPEDYLNGEFQDGALILNDLVFITQSESGDDYYAFKKQK